jgi:hypothetical protein
MSKKKGGSLRYLGKHITQAASRMVVDNKGPIIKKS